MLVREVTVRTLIGMIVSDETPLSSAGGYVETSLVANIVESRSPPLGTMLSVVNTQELRW